MDVRLGFLLVLLLAGNCASDARPITLFDLSGLVEKTQEEIVNALHDACSEIHTLKKQCITLADYYTTLLFEQISSVQPDEFCEKVNLCQSERIVLSRSVKENGCDSCHHAVQEIILKLQDPKTKFDVVEILLRGCNAVEDHWKKVKKCKVMVHKYAPLMVENVEKYLEKNDICDVFHGCSSYSVTENKFDLGKKMFSSS